MGRCEVCEGPSEKTCGYEDQPMLNFCTEHYIEHLDAAHPSSIATQAEAASLRIQLKDSERGLLKQLRAL